MYSSRKNVASSMDEISSPRTSMVKHAPSSVSRFIRDRLVKRCSGNVATTDPTNKPFRHADGGGHDELGEPATMTSPHSSRSLTLCADAHMRPSCILICRVVSKGTPSSSNNVLMSLPLPTPEGFFVHGTDQCTPGRRCTGGLQCRKDGLSQAPVIRPSSFCSKGNA